MINILAVYKHTYNSAEQVGEKWKWRLAQTGNDITRPTGNDAIKITSKRDVFDNC